MWGSPCGTSKPETRNLHVRSGLDLRPSVLHFDSVLDAGASVCILDFLRLGPQKGPEGFQGATCSVPARAPLNRLVQLPNAFQFVRVREQQHRNLLRSVSEPCALGRWSGYDGPQPLYAEQRVLRPPITFFPDSELLSPQIAVSGVALHHGV